MIKWIKNLRSTEKGKILFKFILYMIFFLFVLVLVIVTNAMHEPVKRRSNNSSKIESSLIDESQKELSYIKKQEKLINGKYEIEENDVNVSYYGEYDAGRSDGFRETQDSLIKYSIEEEKQYKHSLNKKEEIDDLYLTYDATLFDIKSLFNKLNGQTALISKSETLKTYIYTSEDYEYKITTTPQEITNIEIVSSNVKFSFTYTY